MTNVTLYWTFLWNSEFMVLWEWFPHNVTQHYCRLRMLNTNWIVKQEHILYRTDPLTWTATRRWPDLVWSQVVASVFLSVYIFDCLTATRCHHTLGYHSHVICIISKEVLTWYSILYRVLKSIFCPSTTWHSAVWRGAVPIEDIPVGGHRVRAVARVRMTAAPRAAAAAPRGRRYRVLGQLRPSVHFNAYMECLMFILWPILLLTNSAVFSQWYGLK